MERHAWRLPARELERAVAQAVEGLIADRAVLAETLRNNDIRPEQINDFLTRASRWRGSSLELVERVDLDHDQIATTISLGDLSTDSGITIRHVVPARFKWRGGETRLVLHGAGTGIPEPNPTLIKAVVRAHRWFDMLMSGHANSIGQIAETDGVSDRNVIQLLPLAFLAPDVVEAVLAGNQPVGLTAEALVRRTVLPLDWTEQKALLGFD